MGTISVSSLDEWQVISILCMILCITRNCTRVGSWARSGVTGVQKEESASASGALSPIRI